jgi:hypothetical protein
MANALCISNNALLIRNNALSIGCGGGAVPTCYTLATNVCSDLVLGPLTDIPIAWPFVGTSVRTAGGSFDRSVTNLGGTSTTVTTVDSPLVETRQWAYVLRARESGGDFFPTDAQIENAYPFATGGASSRLVLSAGGGQPFDVYLFLYQRTTTDPGSGSTVTTNPNGTFTSGDITGVTSRALAGFTPDIDRRGRVLPPAPQSFLLPSDYAGVAGATPAEDLQVCGSESGSGSTPFSVSLSFSASWNFSGTPETLGYAWTGVGSWSREQSNGVITTESLDLSSSVDVTVTESQPVTIPGYPVNAPQPQAIYPDCFGNRPAPPTDPRVAALSPEANVCKGCGE